MDTGVVVTVIVVLVIVLVALFGVWMWVSYSSLIALRSRVDEAWSDIERQMRERAELVPQLVERVEGYASHERAALRAVDDARGQTLAASSPGQATVAETHLQQALKSLYSVADGYPQLAAGQDYLHLQSELAAEAQRIQDSRRFYNGSVRELNAKITVFPNTLFARRLGLRDREFFEVTEGGAVAEPPRIQF